MSPEERDELKLIVADLRNEADVFIVSPVLKKKLRAYAERLEAMVKL